MCLINITMSKLVKIAKEGPFILIYLLPTLMYFFLTTDFLKQEILKRIDLFTFLVSMLRKKNQS